MWISKCLASTYELCSPRILGGKDGQGTLLCATKLLLSLSDTGGLSPLCLVPFSLILNSCHSLLSVGTVLCPRPQYWPNWHPSGPHFSTIESLLSLLPVQSPGSASISLFGCECHLSSLPTWFLRPRKGHTLMQRDAIAATTVEREAHPWYGLRFFSEAVFMSSILVRHFTPSDKCPFALDSSRIQFYSPMGLLFLLGFQTSRTSLNPTSLPLGNGFFQRIKEILCILKIKRWDIIVGPDISKDQSGNYAG